MNLEQPQPVNYNRFWNVERARQEADFEENSVSNSSFSSSEFNFERRLPHERQPSSRPTEPALNINTLRRNEATYGIGRPPTSNLEIRNISRNVIRPATA